GSGGASPLSTHGMGASTGASTGKSTGKPNNINDGKASVDAVDAVDAQNASSIEATSSPHDRWPERIAALGPETLHFLRDDGSIEHQTIPDDLRPETASLGRLAAFAVG